MLPQPDDITCGPTCLHAVYRYHGDDIELSRIIRSVPKLPGGGTLSVLLGIDALKRGYRAMIYTYNLQVFDPTWAGLGRAELSEKLAAQARAKRSAKLRRSSAAYIDFLRRGGELRFEVLSGRLIREFLDDDRPIITGLSSTYLYGGPREFGPNDDPDDIRGQPMGHFVVLCGYDRKAREVEIADPLASNPHSPTRRYSVGINRVLASIMLGVLTYDANLLVLEKPEA